MQAVVQLLRELSADDEIQPAWPGGWARTPKQKRKAAIKYTFHDKLETAAASPGKGRKGKMAAKTAAREEGDNATSMAAWLTKSMKAITKKSLPEDEKTRIMAAFMNHEDEDEDDGSWLFLPAAYFAVAEKEAASRVDYETLMAMMHESVDMVADVLGLAKLAKYAWVWPKHMPPFESVRLYGGE